MRAHALELFICSAQKFLFAASKSFYLQCAKVFTCSVHLLFDDTGIQDYYYLLRDILIVCKFHIINSIFTALQRFYLMKVLSLLGHRNLGLINIFLHVERDEISCGLQPTRFSRNFL